MSDSHANALIKNAKNLGVDSTSIQISEINGDVLALVFVAVDKPIATAASHLLNVIKQLTDQTLPRSERFKLVEQGNAELIRFANDQMEKAI